MARLRTITLPVAGVGAAALVAESILRIEERPSWPPPEHAIAAGDAMHAVAAFDASPSHPGDVGLSYAWSTATTIEPHAGGSEFYPRIFADIEAAESSVHILMFGWKPGVPAEQLVGVLLGRLAAGVEVRILVDAFGSRPHGHSKEMFQRLADAGAEIVVNSFLPPRHEGLYPDARAGWKNTFPCRADHRKLYVIDGSVVWTGGAGIEDHFHDGRFHDTMVRVTGSVVRQAQAVFLTSFRSHQAEIPTDLAALFPEPTEQGSVPTALVQVVPGGFVSATQATREMIDGANHRLEIMNPYLTDDDMIRRIVAAAERGSSVRIVVSQKSNNGLATAAFRHRYPQLRNVGVAICEYPGAVVHAKLIVADDQVQFGTVNLDAWALYRNFELAIIAKSAAVADRFVEQVFDPAVARSVNGEAAVGPTARAISHFASRISPLL